MKQTLSLVLMVAALNGCAQSSGNQMVKEDKKVGGSCEGCEAIYESPVKFEDLSWETTLPGYKEGNPKLHVSGTVYNKDGKTPAKDVILYFYHTDVTGIYPKRGDEKGWGERHGYLRGWVKTDENGRYSFYTIKPGAYPQQTTNPSHIHITVKEHGKTAYWIDDFLFDDDPILSAEDRNRQQNRGGNGILVLTNRNGISEGKRDIVLGKNVPGYN